MSVPCQTPVFKVAFVIVSYNALNFVRICLDSIRRYATIPHEIIVVDNASDEPLRDYLKQQMDIKLILNSDNKLWAEGSNQGIRTASPDCSHILLVNSDIEFRRADCLQQMINVAESSPHIGIVGTYHSLLRIWPTFGGVDGQCMLIKKTLIDEIGVLDSQRFPWNGGPVDFAARAFKKGYIYKIMPASSNLVVHYGAMSCRSAEIIEPSPQREALPDSRQRKHLQILKDAGLDPRPIPRWLWSLYKRIPGKLFYHLTRDEIRLAEGRDSVRKRFYARFS